MVRQRLSMVFRFTWVSFALEGVCAGMVVFALGNAHELFICRSHIANHNKILIEPILYMADFTSVKSSQLSHNRNALAPWLSQSSSRYCTKDSFMLFKGQGAPPNIRHDQILQPERLRNTETTCPAPP
jgi:hypothetical protein